MAENGEALELGGLTAALHRPDKATGDAIILAHGAGGNLNAPLLILAARALAAAGFLAIRYNLPFRQQRASGPPHPSSAIRDREGIRQAAAAARELGATRIFGGGHSYGARQTTMLASESPGLFTALFLCAYPLHPPGKPETLRTAHFPALRTLCLFIHGSKDPFGTEPELRQAIQLIPAETKLIVIEGAGHDLRRARELGAAVESFRQLVRA